MDRKTIRFLKILSTGLVIVAMIFAFLIAGIRIFGVQVYGVLTGSMEPTYPTGSLIYVKRVDASELRVNDVITFSISSNVIATHRIVEIVPDETNPTVMRYRTKGDANNDVDASLVSASNIIGRVIFGIPQMGYLANYIQHPPGIYVAIIVCGLMIAFVFYTDSLENKQKANFQRSNRRGGYGPQKRPRPRQSTQQRAYSQARGYTQQREYSQRRERPPQRDYSQQKRYPQQRSYTPEREYSRQRGYSQRGDYSEQRRYSAQREYPRQRDYYQRRESTRQDEHSQQRNRRTGRE